MAFVLAAPAAFAERVRCRDIDAAMTAGKTPAEIRDELGVTATRIEACHRIAASKAQRAERRTEQQARRAERQLSRD